MSKTIKDVLDTMSEEKRIVFTYIIDEVKTSIKDESEMQHSDDLLHYGVLGMKWGKRKVQRTYDQAANNARRLKYKMEKGYAKVERKHLPTKQALQKWFDLSVEQNHRPSMETALRMLDNLEYKETLDKALVDRKYGIKLRQQELLRDVMKVKLKEFGDD